MYGTQVAFTGSTNFVEIVPQEAISFGLQAGYHFGHSVVVDASTALALVALAHGSLLRQLLMVAGSSSGLAARS
jgi:hypothetical protein